MSDIIDRAHRATDELLGNDEDKLYQNLGTRLRAIALNPEGSGQFTFAGDQIETLGTYDELKEFGRRYFNKVEDQIHGLICGSEDAKVRKEILASFGLGREAVAATIAALLVSHVGIAPAIAAVLAALAIKIFFKPAHEAMCEQWSDARANRKTKD